MRALLDVSTLLALSDPAHIHHDAAHGWFEVQREHGWASCAITENGVVRISSQPAYPQPLMAEMAVHALALTCERGDHEYWPCDVTIRDAATIDRSKILGPKQLTDIYLLALAVAHGGRLVTFDRGISLAAVPGATAENLVML